MERLKIKIGNMKIVLILLAFALSIGLINAEASLQVSSFSCSPSEVTINSVFSCTARITNTGDASAVLDMATLYVDTNNWLESSTYAQSSGTTLNTSQSTEITFTGLRAVKSGNNGFQKIMLDTVERTDYVSTTKVNAINVVVSIGNSASSAARGGSVTSTAEVTSGGNINVILSFAVDSGGCSIGSQTNPVIFNGMTDGSKQTKVWTVTQGTGSSARSCRFSVSASATGTGGIASKISSTPSTITCTDCLSDATDSSGSGGSGGGGGGGGGGSSTIYELGEITASASKELAKNEKIKFGISSLNHTLTLNNLTETQATITIESKKQTFTIVVGNSINVDLNEDNDADIKIRLDSINILSRKATFTITKISGGEPSSASKSSENTGTGNSANEGERSKGESLFSMQSNNLIYWVIGIVVAIVIIFMIVFTLLRKNKGLSYRKRYY